MVCTAVVVGTVFAVLNLLFIVISQYTSTEKRDTSKFLQSLFSTSLYYALVVAVTYGLCYYDYTNLAYLPIIFGIVLPWIFAIVIIFKLFQMANEIK